MRPRSEEKRGPHPQPASFKGGNVSRGETPQPPTPAATTQCRNTVELFSFPLRLAPRPRRRTHDGVTCRRGLVLDVCAQSRCTGLRG